MPEIGSEVALTSDPRLRFLEFYRSFEDRKGRLKYRERIRKMILLRQRSLVVDFPDLVAYDKDLAKEVLKAPTIFIEAASKAITDIVKIDDPDYAKSTVFYARFRRLPEAIPLRSLRAEHIGRLIMVEGILTRATPVKQQLTEAVFQCEACGERTIIAQEGIVLRQPARCTNPACGKRGSMRLLIEESKFRDWQKLVIQERPEELPPGQLPRNLEVIVRDDLVDRARPGDRVTIVGILNVKQERAVSGAKLSTFSTYLEANNIEVAEAGLGEVEITSEDERKILELAKSPDIHERIIRSIAPSIYGYEHIKEAVAYQLFGGEPKVYPDGVRVRGDIHILLVGDPGTAKSQLLKYAARLAPRGLYTSGKGSTAAGLTAAVVRDKRTGEFYLEAGALVLSDKGIACIDEFDKMDNEDRASMHEAMEQQTVSIAKAGIVATLNARCAVLAAANPKYGRYVYERSFNENIDERKLPPTILSRFDLIFVITDKPERGHDARLAEHVLKLHGGTYVEEEGVIPPELLRKYIAYARERIHPKLSVEAIEKIKDFYLEMRGRAEGGSSPVPITPRQLESLVRLAEARAKMALREIVTAEDAEAAIRLMKTYLSSVGYDEETGSIDIDIVMVGKPRSQQEKILKVMDIIKMLEESRDGEPVPVDEIYEEAEAQGLSREFVEKTLRRMRNDGLIYEPRTGYIKRT